MKFHQFSETVSISMLSRSDARDARDSGIRPLAPVRLRDTITNDPDAEELSQVLHEVTEAMGAVTSVLTVHPESRSPLPVHVDERAVDAAITVPRLLDRLLREPRLEQGEHAWLSFEADGEDRDVLAIPIQRTSGHDRLVISTFFRDLSAAQRHHAEEVYLSRRPFAVGYFRLWQRDRTRARHIEALEAALNLTEFGVVLLDLRGRLTFANEAAAMILDAGDGLRRHRGGIACTTVKDSARLQLAVDQVARPDPNDDGGARLPLLKVARAERPALIVSVMPTSTPAHEAGDAAAILYILDPALDTGQLLEPVCKLFDLSPVETRLACLLAAGAPLTIAAEAMRIKEQTARTYLKQVFQKTGTNRQADLVRVMLSSLVRTIRALPRGILQDPVER